MGHIGKILFSPHVKHYTIGLVQELIKNVDVDLFHYYHYSLFAKPILPSNKFLRFIKKRFLYKKWFKKYEIFHCNSPFEASEAKYRKGLMLTLHGHVCPEFVKDSEKPYVRKVKEAVLKAKKKGMPIIAISNYLANILEEYLNINCQKVIHHGCLDIFRKKPRKWTKNHRILWISRLIPRKRPELLLHAIKQIKDIDFSVLMVGKGWMKARLEGMIGEYGLKNKVKIVDKYRFDDMPNVYDHATFYVHTCDIECFGFTVLEAMASALPVIVPNSGGALEVGGDACLRYNDVSELAEAIIALIENKRIYEKYSEKAAERAKQFDWKEVARNYLSLYRSLI